jgi:HPt (histidine-containing phosphotransfer) domain-containing protein
MRGALGTIGATRLIEQVSELERDLANQVPHAQFAARGRQIHDGLVTLVTRLDAQLGA